MSLKHLKFGESFSMRSFEKLAQEKGLIKADPVIKMAKKSVDLTPSDSLLNNIIRLSSGLRAQGFITYAEELEKKCLMFKEANTLYETSKEKGEDLIDAAHPKGSHKLVGVLGDAVVETIVDQDNKIMDVVNKKPTGKLASKDIIKMVKIVLGQDRKSELEKGMNDIASKIIDKLNLLNSIVSGELTFSIDGFINDASKLLMSPSRDTLEYAKKLLVGNNPGSLEYRLKPGLLGGLKKGTWDVVSALLYSLPKKIDDMLVLQLELDGIKGKSLVEDKPFTPAPAVQKSDELEDRIKKALSTIALYQNFLDNSNLDTDDKNSGKKQLDALNQKLLQSKKMFDLLAPEQKDEGKSLISGPVKVVEQDIVKFKSLWFK